MRAETALNAVLNAAAGVTALVGSGAAARIYPGELPLGTALPALCLEHVSGGELTTIDAASNYGLVQSRMQVTAIAKTYPEVKTVLEQVRLACNYQRGTFGGVNVVSIVRELIGPDLRDPALGLYSQSLDFMVTLKEQ